MVDVTPNWQEVTVRGKFVGVDKLPIEGVMTFTPQATRLLDAAALTTIIGRSVRVTLDDLGAFAQALPATDDPDITPTGFTYRVEEGFPGGLTYNISVPLADAVAGIDLATVAPVAPNIGSPDNPLTRGEMVAYEAEFIVIRDTAAAQALTWRDAWAAGTAYIVQDAVSYAGSTWRRKVAGTTATAPSADATNWGLVAAAGVADDAGMTAIDANAAAAFRVQQDARVAAASTADRDRANHTGTQLAATVSDFTTAADARITAQKAAASGLATLDSGGKVPAGQLPSYVDDVLEYANLAAFPGAGTAGIIYVALDTSKTYRWSGTAYVEISPSDVNSVAGKTGAVSLVKADVGLGSVDNTADTGKPVSTAQQTALDLKAPLASPAFTTAATLDGQALVKTNDARLADSGWLTPTLLNSWVNFGAGYAEAKYRKIGNRVTVKAMVKNGTAALGTVLFVLDAGYRPPETLLIASTSNDLFAFIGVGTGGGVSLEGGSNTYLAVNFSFLID